MKKQIKAAAATTTSALLLTSMGAAGIAALNTDLAQAETTTPATVMTVERTASSPLVTTERVQGHFTFTQNAITPISTIAKNMSTVAKHLCGSTLTGTNEEVSDINEWTISVSGAVKNAFEATLGELSKEGSAQLVMGCSCAGNPANGLGSVNAEVLGVSLNYIITQAKISDEVNTVVFSASDGYEVALPLNYVTQRFSLIAFNINGEPVANSMGGANQLWMGSTPANYFARNITALTFEARETPPPVPGSTQTNHAYLNTPNITVDDAVSKVM